MDIDHIFIFSPNNGQEVDELVEFGLTEGSGRSHQGIGTINRRIFFENVYLEILWVQKTTETQQTARELGLWQRANFMSSQYSPFGLCLSNRSELDEMFTFAFSFHAAFLPPDKTIDVITNEVMPWIFRFPLIERKQSSTEPKTHRLGLKKLTKASFYLKKLGFEYILHQIEVDSIIEFKQSDQHFLCLEFDNCVQGKEKTFERLNLKIKY